MLPYAQSVLDLGAEQLEEVVRLHDDAKAKGEVSGRMQALIKNVVENQRSPLDYVAQAVADAYCQRGIRPYWIASRDRAEYKTDIERELPGLLASQPKIAAAFELHQPFQSDHGWVLQLFALTRENKHHKLTPQTRIEKVVPLPVRAGPGPKGVTIVIEGWAFAALGLPVVETLRRIQTGVQEAVEDVCAIAAL